MEEKIINEEKRSVSFIEQKVINDLNSCVKKFEEHSYGKR